MQSELNKKLYAIIKTAPDTDGNLDHVDIMLAANDCEKICLQDKIDLLYEATSANSISLIINKLKEQLNQLE